MEIFSSPRRPGLERAAPARAHRSVDEHRVHLRLASKLVERAAPALRLLLRGQPVGHRHVQAKRLFAERISAFVGSATSSPYTDITGGLLQAIEFLNEKGPAEKTVLIFSDLKEDLDEGYIRDIEFNLDGYRIVALNVTKLRSDNVDPREYLARLDAWQQKVERSGGQWRVINDLEGLEGLL